MNKYIKAMLS